MTLLASETALILAPQGRDGPVAAAMLAEAGIHSDVVRDLSELVTKLQAGAGFAVVTEEALAGAPLHELSEWIEAQEEWSDFPFVLLTRRGGGLERNPAAGRYLELLGNATFLERPFHPTTLVSLAQSALRGRRRQYEARARLQDLNDLAKDLERRVEERTAEHEAAVAQLHEAQKLETLGQLTGGVAHDFNNLLTPITGALDLLNRKYGETDPRSARLLTNALQAADRAKTLLQRLLGFARRQSLQMQSVDIAGLLTGIKDLISSSVGPTIAVKLRCEADLQPALVDPNQLELAILNLAVNARDAMPDGGPLTIIADEVAIGPQSEPKVRPGLYVRVSVIDAGLGMDPETLSRAIEPFFSTKEGRGTGLGLSMVHGLTGQIGGGFSLSSVQGQGTQVDLYLPVASEPVAAGRKSATDPVRTLGRPLRVLLVDDEDIVRAATAEMVRDLGHEVAEVQSGPEALSHLEEDSAFDVMVTDYMMPGMNGGMLAQRVAKAYPQIAVLLITGYTGPTQDVLHLPRLDKPFGQAEVACAVAGLFPDAKDTQSTVIRFPRKSAD